MNGATRCSATDLPRRRHEAAISGSRPSGSILGIVLFWSGWRGPDRIFRPLALIVVGLWFADAVYTIGSGNDIMFEGATLGVSLSIGKIALAYYGGAARR